MCRHNNVEGQVETFHSSGLGVHPWNLAVSGEPDPTKQHPPPLQVQSLLFCWCPPTPPHLTPSEVSCAALDIPACLSSVSLPSNCHSLGQTSVLVACTPATRTVIRKMDPGAKLVGVLPGLGSFGEWSGRGEIMVLRLGRSTLPRSLLELQNLSPP